MKHAEREERIVHQMHRHLTLIVVVAIVIGGFVYFDFRGTGFLGPMTGGPSNGTTLEWYVSDQTADTENPLLVNQLEGEDIPKYDAYGAVALKRDSNGKLVALPRIQGTVRYCTTTLCDDD
ncbi:MAG: hypothetical protein NUV80_00150 [Candidatus Berkelbacteria bacterium]|nr:hypothetical protein [Candidatus Berkelbacteria bacterium]MCR4306963.1 hypothetical protein [Candidatus Berkelbacteria bacterium]